MMKILKILNPAAAYRHFAKWRLYRRFACLGDNVSIPTDSRILTPQHIRIGSNVFLGEQIYISAWMKIGSNVMFGPQCTIIGGDHYWGVTGHSVFTLDHGVDYKPSEIIVEDEVWVGARSVILKNTTLDIGCIIGAGSVVTKSIPPFVIACGNPAKPICRIFDDEMLVRHMTGLKYPPEYISSVIEKRNSMLGDRVLPVRDQNEKFIREHGRLR